MSTAKDIVDAINLPRALLDKTSAFLQTLLGPATREVGELLADRIRLRRYRNQVTMLREAQEILDVQGLPAREVPLRTLVPLVEKASLEEDPDIQEMWATLLANASYSSAPEAIHSICIAVLGAISPQEATIMRLVYADFLEREPRLLAEWAAKGLKRRRMPAGLTFLRPAELLRRACVAESDGEVLLDNLQRLGVLRQSTPELDDGEIQEPEYLELTELGLRVLEACIAPPSARTAG